MSAFENLANPRPSLAPPTPSPALAEPHYVSEFVPAGAITPATTSGPATDKQELADGTNIDRLLFDGASQETAYFNFVPDEGWDLGKIRVRLVWNAATGGSGGVAWGVSAKAVSNDDPLSSSYPTDQVLYDTVTSEGDNHTTGTAEVEVGGSPQRGDLVIFRVRRVPSLTGDTMSQDAGLIGAAIQLRYNRTPSAWA